jgi:hypothetical protein
LIRNVTVNCQQLSLSRPQNSSFTAFILKKAIYCISLKDRVIDFMVPSWLRGIEDNWLFADLMAGNTLIFSAGASGWRTKKTSSVRAVRLECAVSQGCMLEKSGKHRERQQFLCFFVPGNECQGCSRAEQRNLAC